jgi:ABC-type transport system involved in multi-copper enzyme maturation permease subunit
MDAPSVLYALRWLIHDTFRQTLSSRVFWIMLGLSAICILFCLGVGVEGGTERDEGEIYTKSGKVLAGPNEEPGRMTLLFGMFPLAFSRTANEEVLFIRSIFASWIAGTIGVLVALIWTAGFVPESLQPSAASVLLAKPVPRWLFLLGKYLGVVSFVALQATIFFVGTWFALGIKTDVWQIDYLVGIPLITFHFAIIFAFSVMLAVLFRSTMACVVGGVLFWIVCYAINYGRHFAVVYPDLNPGAEALPDFTLFLSELGYWLLPKPADMTIIQQNLLNLDGSMMTLEASEPFKTVVRKDLFHPVAALTTSCLFPIFALWAAASQLGKTDY